MENRVRSVGKRVLFEMPLDTLNGYFLCHSNTKFVHRLGPGEHGNVSYENVKKYQKCFGHFMTFE